MNKRIAAQKRYLKNNRITYEELLKSGDECVRVSRVFFSCLAVLNQQAKQDDKKFWEIIYKYYKVDDMTTYLGGPGRMIRYFLVSVNELKYLIDNTKKLPELRAILLKSDTKVSELEDEINDLKIKYEKKKEENYNKRNGSQLIKRK